MNMAKNLPYIIILCLAGALFLFIAMMYLPLVLLYPSKFSFSIAVSSMCFMGVIALLKGPQAFLSSLISAEKIKYTGVYAISLLGTFYSSMIMKSYIAALFFCALQVRFRGYLVVFCNIRVKI